MDQIQQDNGKNQEFTFDGGDELVFQKKQDQQFFHIAREQNKNQSKKVKQQISMQMNDKDMIMNQNFLQYTEHFKKLRDKVDKQVYEKYEAQFRRNKIFYTNLQNIQTLQNVEDLTLKPYLKREYSLSNQCYIKKENFNFIRIKDYFFSHNNSILQLLIQLGNFTMKLETLIQNESFFHQNQQDKIKNPQYKPKVKINRQGVSGLVYVASIENTQNMQMKNEILNKKNQFCVKCIHLRKDQNKKIQLLKILYEYCVAKIASIMEIGPKILLNLGFDIIFTQSCAEFRMQKCLTSKDFIFNKKLESNLYENMRKMHSIRLIHRDIKPANVLFSQTTNKFVFCDFGISHFVKQNCFNKTLTKFMGTSTYVMRSLLNLGQRKYGYINLYENDFYGCHKTIRNIYSQKRIFSKNQQSLQKSQQIPIIQPFNNNSSSSEYTSSQQQNESSLEKHLYMINLKYRLFKRQPIRLNKHLFNFSQQFFCFLCESHPSNQSFCRNLLQQNYISLERYSIIIEKMNKYNPQMFYNLNLRNKNAQNQILLVNTKKTNRNQQEGKKNKDNHYSFQTNQSGFNFNQVCKKIEFFQIKDLWQIFKNSGSTLSPKNILLNKKKIATMLEQEYFTMFFNYIKLTHIRYKSTLQQKLEVCKVFQSIKFQKNKLNQEIKQLMSFQKQPKQFFDSNLLPIICCLRYLLHFAVAKNQRFSKQYIIQIYFQLTFLHPYYLSDPFMKSIQKRINYLNIQTCSYLNQNLKLILNIRIFQFNCMRHSYFQNLFNKYKNNFYEWNQKRRQNLQKSNSLKSQIQINLINFVQTILKQPNLSEEFYKENEFQINSFENEVGVQLFQNIERLIVINKYSNEYTVVQRVFKFNCIQKMINNYNSINLDFAILISTHFDKKNLNIAIKLLDIFDNLIQNEKISNLYFLNIRLFQYFKRNSQINFTIINLSRQQNKRIQANILLQKSRTFFKTLIKILQYWINHKYFKQACVQIKSSIISSLNIYQNLLKQQEQQQQQYFQILKKKSALTNQYKNHNYNRSISINGIRKVQQFSALLDYYQKEQNIIFFYQIQKQKQLKAVQQLFKEKKQPFLKFFQLVEKLFKQYVEILYEDKCSMSQPFQTQYILNIFNLYKKSQIDLKLEEKDFKYIQKLQKFLQQYLKNYKNQKEHNLKFISMKLRITFLKASYHSYRQQYFQASQYSKQFLQLKPTIQHLCNRNLCDAYFNLIQNYLQSLFKGFFNNKQKLQQSKFFIKKLENDTFFYQKIIFSVIQQIRQQSLTYFYFKNTVIQSILRLLLTLKEYQKIYFLLQDLTFQVTRQIQYNTQFNHERLLHVFQFMSKEMQKIKNVSQKYDFFMHFLEYAYKNQERNKDNKKQIKQKQTIKMNKFVFMLYLFAMKGITQIKNNCEDKNLMFSTQKISIMVFYLVKRLFSYFNLYRKSIPNFIFNYFKDDYFYLYQQKNGISSKKKRFIRFRTHNFLSIQSLKRIKIKYMQIIRKKGQNQKNKQVQELKRKMMLFYDQSQLMASFQARQKQQFHYSRYINLH